MTTLQIVLLVSLVVLVIILFMYAFRDKNTLQNLQSARVTSTISSSSLAGSNKVAPTNFAYSAWFYINDWNYRYGEPKVIFGRMGATSNSKNTGSIPGISGIDPCPVVVLGNTNNTLTVHLSCFPGSSSVTSKNRTNSIVHSCSIPNVPIQKWVNLTFSVYGRTLDVYIDGKLVKTCMLPGIANVKNEADLVVTPNGGFDGWTSKIQYYPNSLNPQDAWNIYVKGYGSGFVGGLSNYRLQLSVIKNGVNKKTITI